MKTAARVCLITPGNVASNPRLVKEAHALIAAGYSLRIVAADVIPSLSRYDAEIFAELPCDHVRISAHLPRHRHLVRAALQRAARRALPLAGKTRAGLQVSTWAHHQLTYALAREAARHPADLYLAHNLAALPAAAWAAERHGTRFGFDAEDFHSGELDDTPENEGEHAARVAIEGALLPRCHHLTAASPGIADQYRRRYGVRMETVLNVFPIAEAPASPTISHDAPGREPSLYWFSQTVGAQRGLEAVVQAMGRMRTRARLRVRGNPAEGYIDALCGYARRVGGEDLARRIDVLPVAPPSEMARLAAEHDVGLALELAQPLNRAICLTNKIFVYLLAGIPVCLSLTPAQNELARDLGDAAWVTDIGNAAAFAESLDLYLRDPGRQQRARHAAWRLGQTTYNWDREQHRYLAVVASGLDGAASAIKSSLSTVQSAKHSKPTE